MSSKNATDPSLKIVEHAQPEAESAFGSKVSLRFVQAALKHVIPEQPFLWMHNVKDWVPEPLEGAVQYNNTWTGQEIELMVAIFSRAGWTQEKGFGRNADFKTKNELIALAAGGNGDIRSIHRTSYLKALQTLLEPHDLLYRENGRTFLENGPQIIMKTIQAKKGKIHRFEISDSLIRAMTQFRALPLSISNTFHRGGLRRVETSHIKLFLFLANQIGSRHKCDLFAAETIFAAMGLMSHFDSRNHGHATKQLEAGLNALKQAGVLEWAWMNRPRRPLSRAVQIRPNPFYWKTARLVQVHTSERT